jgi:superfamily II DNA/RNA helicase
MTRVIVLAAFVTPILIESTKVSKASPQRPCGIVIVPNKESAIHVKEQAKEMSNGKIFVINF